METKIAAVNKNTKVMYIEPLGKGDSAVKVGYPVSVIDDNITLNVDGENVTINTGNIVLINDSRFLNTYENIVIDDRVKYPISLFCRRMIPFCQFVDMATRNAECEYQKKVAVKNSILIDWFGNALGVVSKTSLFYISSDESGQAIVKHGVIANAKIQIALNQRRSLPLFAVITDNSNVDVITDSMVVFKDGQPYFDAIDCKNKYNVDYFNNVVLSEYQRKFDYQMSKN